jgi:MoxR-like ATPase
MQPPPISGGAGPKPGEMQRGNLKTSATTTMKKLHNLAVEEPTADTETIRNLIRAEVASIELDIDDTEIKASIAAVQKDNDNKHEAHTVVLRRIVQDNTAATAKLDLAVAAKLETLSADTMKGLDTIANAVNSQIATEIGKRVNTAATYDEAKLRQVADSVFQTLFVNGVAQSAKSGGKQPLPALQKVDPFFVENDQTGRIALALRTRRHSMASGPSGAGKTYPIEQVLRKEGRRYLKVSVADGLSYADFIARANVRATDKGTETYYTYGFLPFSMTAGLVLVLDEVDQCQPEIMSIINAALECRRIYIPQTGETIEAHKDWQVFMTCNTLRDSSGAYSGFRLNAALLNRLIFIKADYLPAAAEVEILTRVGLAKADAKKIVGILHAMRAAYAQGKMTQAPSTRIAVRIARIILGHDDDGAEVADSALTLADAFAVALLDGLPDSEVKEAANCIAHGL